MNISFKLFINPEANIKNQHYFQLAKLTSTTLGKSYTELKSFALEVCDDKKIIGGMTGTIQNSIMIIDVLWVDKCRQNSGFGSDLLKNAIELAKKNNCSRLITTNFEFQNNLVFWEKNGFSIFGTLENCLHNSKLFYLQKLIENPSAT